MENADGERARGAPGAAGACLVREFAVAVVRVGLLGLAGAEFCPNLLQRPGSRRSAERETLIFRASSRGRSRLGAPLQQIWTNGTAAGPRDEDAARLTATARPGLRPIRGAEAMPVRADGAGRGYGRSREGRGPGSSPLARGLRYGRSREGAGDAADGLVAPTTWATSRPEARRPSSRSPFLTSSALVTRLPSGLRRMA